MLLIFLGLDKAEDEKWDPPFLLTGGGLAAPLQELFEQLCLSGSLALSLPLGNVSRSGAGTGTSFALQIWQVSPAARDKEGSTGSAEQGPGPGCSQVLGPSATAWPRSACVGPCRAWEAAAGCSAPHGTHEVPSCHRAGPHP